MVNSILSERLPPIVLQKPKDSVSQHPATVDIPLEEIRRANDVERWRNKVRLQEKFEVSVHLFHSPRTSPILATLR